jgi:hypothetical protein
MSHKLSEALKAAEDHKLAFDKLEGSIRESDLGISSLATWKANVTITLALGEYQC